MSKSSLAHRQTVGEISDGKIPQSAYDDRLHELIENPPEAIRMESAYEAAYRTFTLPPGPRVRAFHRMIAGLPFNAGRFQFPFVNTPAQIFSYTFERTPLAPFTQRFRAAVAKGGAEADLAWTRMSLGTMAMMFAVDLGLQGHLTGSGPKDKGEKAAQMRSGWRPNALRLGSKFITISRVDPVGFLLGLGGEIAEWLTNDHAPDEQTMAQAEEGFAAGVFAIVETVLSKSYMQSLALLTEAVNDPGGYGEQWVNRFAASWVPTAVKDVAQAIDPVKRHTNDIWSSIKARLPYFREDLPAQNDLWGREIKYSSGFTFGLPGTAGEIAGRGYDILSPLYGSSYKPEPIDEVMLQDGWNLEMSGHSFHYNGEVVSLRNRPDIKNRFYKLRGGTKPSEMGEFGDKVLGRYGDKTLLETLNEMVKGKGDLGPDWKEAETPEDRKNLAKGVFNDYRDAATDFIKDEYADWFDRVSNAQRRAKGFATIEDDDE